MVDTTTERYAYAASVSESDLVRRIEPLTRRTSTDGVRNEKRRHATDRLARSQANSGHIGKIRVLVASWLNRFGWLHRTSGWRLSVLKLVQPSRARAARSRQKQLESGLNQASAAEARQLSRVPTPRGNDARHLLTRRATSYARAAHSRLRFPLDGARANCGLRESARVNRVPDPCPSQCNSLRRMSRKCH